ncbi:kinesin-like protein KIN-10B isoform X2 [Phoenix dactylifera]|uniref:Kinesin-like protein KIN-10B isoform X2 n=1 Tax=Phoenix dactylifera TaxID=42345 RepID=A0A8B7MTP0_PHODC|nr:kinesin-like protein KIN-10B isoform X2 [Phoenix dactylifera]
MDSSSAESSAEFSGSQSWLQSRRGVRVVGRIRSFRSSEIVGASDGESSCSSSRAQISLTRCDGDYASISFGDQSTGRKDSYKLDWCYKQDEGISEIFSREVKPLIQGIFHGRNACVIAYGARGSGKTQMIQGSEEDPGLAPMAISEILMSATEVGGSVAISCYEVYQDHIYDLLDPKEQEVLVLEDAGRKIQLKGLSQVPVNSIVDFKKLFTNACNQRRPQKKSANDTSIRSHRGMIIYVSVVDKKTNHSLIGKMNFVDLAGYEDTKQKSNAYSYPAESAKVNKSLYTLLNVIYALNANGTYIPYRESKLTRLLQDFICRASGAVLITCVNPTLCQDTINAVSLASRSCQMVNHHRHDTTKSSSKSVSKFIPTFSPSNGGSRAQDTLVKKHQLSQFASTERKRNGTPFLTKRRPQPLSKSMKKPGPSLFSSVEKKTNNSTSLTKGRKLFNATSPSPKSIKKNALSDSTCGDTSTQSEETCVSPIAPDVQSKIPESPKDVSFPNEHNDIRESETGLDISAKLSADSEESTTKENHESLVNMAKSSPPLSERLREISNSLKLLSTRQICIGTPKVDVSYYKQGGVDHIEPKTPGVPFNLRLDGNSNFETGTPQDIFRTRSTGLKKSLVQECLSFLNSANKEELKKLKGIGEKRATYILQLREETPEPFKEIEDLKELGLSSKQIGGMMSGILEDF